MFSTKHRCTHIWNNKCGIKNTLFLFAFLFSISFTAFAQRSFSGADIDSQSGLSDCRNRVMDPETGTFLQKDPIGISGGLNTYLYCNNNPVNYIDPLGLNWFDNVVNFGTGMGDAVSFGGTQWLRNQFSVYDGTVNYSSGSYAGGQITGYGVAGALTGAAGAAIITRAAPLAVQALDLIPGVTAVQAAGAVDMGLLVTAGAGVVATGISSGYAIQNNDWNSLAFNIGTLGGGAIIGVSPFGGASSGGRYMANSIGALSGAGKSQASMNMNISAALANEWDKSVPQFLLKGGTPNWPQWAASAPTPFIGGLSATTTASGVASVGFNLYESLVQPLVGGVLLDKAAQLVGQNLSDITGAMYDPVSGQFVFLGTNNPTPVKNINLDYLYTALQAVYGSAQPPFVTLNPAAAAYTPWADMGNGNGIFEPGERGGFIVRYNPIWDIEDTTVDVTVSATWNSTKYKWKARFNCVADYGPAITQSSVFKWRARFNCVNNTNLVFSRECNSKLKLRCIWDSEIIAFTHNLGIII